jgi:hypothetical protein
MKSIKTTPSKGLKSKFIKILKSKISTRETRGRHFAHCRRTTIKKSYIGASGNHPNIARKADPDFLGQVS